MAYLMRTAGLKPAFDWLPLTVLNVGEYVDHHFLYHVLLIPFTYGDLRMGAKLASALFPAVTFVAVWALLHRQRVPAAALWAAGLLTISEAFLYRMSMPRTQSLSLLVLVLALHWLLSGRYRRLLPLAFLYVWLYDAFPLILVVCGVYLIAVWLTERRLVWRPLAFAGTGAALGLVINPYFPQNLVFVYRHLVPKLLDPLATRVGNEWYPYETAQLLGNSGLALVLFVVGVLALGLHGRRMSRATATSLLLTILFGGMLFQARRFVEYFPPFALTFAALACAPLLADWFAAPRLPGQQRTLTVAAALFLPVALWFGLLDARQSVAQAKPHQRYEAAASWLSANAPPGSLVFQTDWDDFPSLFYHNTDQIYTLGLDPTYMQLYDSSLYDLWVDVSQGRVEQPASAIRQRFGAEYVFTDLKHAAFLNQAAGDSTLEEVYRDEYAVVFAVLQPGTAKLP